MEKWSARADQPARQFILVIDLIANKIVYPVKMYSWFFFLFLHEEM